MRSYDLMHAKWIACALIDGTQRLMGLASVITRAGDIREIAERSPLVTFGIHRLLLAVLHWLAPIRNLQDWQRRWEAGRFDVEIANNVRIRGHKRFDLFEQENPFYQDASVSGRRKPVSCLRFEIPGTWGTGAIRRVGM